MFRALRHSLAAAIALAAVALAACGPPEPPERDAVCVYAAASLTDAVGGLAREFETAGRGRVVAAFDASNTLAQQLQRGALPGVFISASVEWVDALDRAGLVEPWTRADLLGNSLVVIVPRGAADPPASLSDLANARFDRIALADPLAVPAGKYAQEALRRAGVFDTVRPRIVAALDVRHALAYVERGDAPAGIVYATDATSSSGVDVAVRVPPDLHPAIVYPIVLVRESPPKARDLYEFLRSGRAREVFERAGFVVIR